MLAFAGDLVRKDIEVMNAQMLLQYFAGGGNLYHGRIINDTSGQPAAVVTGSYASGRALPWNIRGRRVLDCCRAGLKSAGLVSRGICRQAIQTMLILPRLKTQH